MPNSATDFSAAMQTALKAFSSKADDDANANSNSGASNVMLIISDGENHGEGYGEALASLSKQNISLYTLGIGSRRGGTIPVYNESGALTGYKGDETGKTITTKLEPEVLRDIAQQGDGEYYAIRAGNDGIDAFLARLDDLQQGEFASQEYADYKNQYQWLAGIGLGFLLISLVLPEYKKKQ
jgi:Ca-activated chloride channel family protein